MSTPPEATPNASRALLVAALALALGAAVSLGLARFAYALLLPPMRADLGWSYFTAGAMNTANAAGYLAGALSTPLLLARRPAKHVFVGGALLAALTLALHALVRAEGALYALRFATGVASALTFVSGGLLAAQLASRHEVREAGRTGLILGLYYGGTGIGIIVAALALPPIAAITTAASAATAGRVSTWPWGWVALALVSLVFAEIMRRHSPEGTHTPRADKRSRVPLRRLAFGLAAYFCFGLGYIGYMTFIVQLLTLYGLRGREVAALYALLGLAVIVSPFLWARLLDRHRDGTPMLLLNGLLALATLLPVATDARWALVLSVAGFGAVFLSVVASTTALVRHNAPAEAWSGGIAAFTTVFAVGQIVGPSLVGWIADRGGGPTGGLAGGLTASTAVLAVGAVLAAFQREAKDSRGTSASQSTMPKSSTSD